MTTLLPREVSAVRTGADAFVPAPLRLAARQRVAEMMTLGCRALGLPLVMPDVSFDLRGRGAGMAVTTFQGKRALCAVVRLNAKLLLSNTQEQMDVTIPHEVAHVLVAFKWGRCKPHGQEWQSVMRALGQRPDVTHDMDVQASRVVARDYHYDCGCQVHRLTSIRHKKIATGRKRYKCTECGNPLRYIGKAGQPAPQPSIPQRPRIPMAPSAPPAPASRPVHAAPPVPARPVVSPTVRAPAPAPARLPPSPATQGSPAWPAYPVLAPTERQLAYASDLARRRGVTIPPDVRYNRQLLSQWIDRQASVAA